MSAPLINIIRTPSQDESPIPPPRFKKLRRQKALASSPTTDGCNGTAAAPTLMLPVLPDANGNDEMNDRIRHGSEGLVTSNDSLFESFDERNLEDEEDDVRCCSDGGRLNSNAKTPHHDSTQSLTSDLQSTATSRSVLITTLTHY
jgi:hypothetical protein